MYVSRDGSAEARTQRHGTGKGRDDTALGEEGRDPIILIIGKGTVKYWGRDGTVLGKGRHSTGEE